MSSPRQLLDDAMPWLMLAWSVAQLVIAMPLARQHSLNDPRLGGALAALVTTWCVVAGAAIALAVRHAARTAGAPRLAWCMAAASLVLALPLAVSFLAEQRETEDSGTTCIPGLLPRKVPGALFGWIPFPAYVWTAVAPALAGLAALASRRTRRAGAWALSGVLMGVSLYVSSLLLIVNHCD